MKVRVLTLLGVITSNCLWAATPSPEQIQMFLSLPKSQQEQLAKQFGIDINDIQGFTQNDSGRKSTDTSISQVGLADFEAVEEEEEEPQLFDEKEVTNLVERCIKEFGTSASKEEKEQESIQEMLDSLESGETETVEAQLERKERLKYINIESILESRLQEEHEELDPVASCIKSFFEYKKLMIAEKVSFEKSLEEEFTEAEPLEPFGLELFRKRNSSLLGADRNIPVPLSYIMGPGDTVIVQLYGKEHTTHELTLTREGVLQFPDVGPLNVNGMSFKELKSFIKSTVSQQMIGIEVNVTLGELRSIPIFVMGEVKKPGSYMVNALGTVGHALYAAGGITEIGSMRRIQLKRKNKIHSMLDLYSVLLKGDIDKNVRLLPGDVIFIPPAGKMVGIEGEVKRSAFYEILEEKNIGDLITLAGGLLPTAYSQAVTIERIDNNGDRTLIDVNLKKRVDLEKSLYNGDLINIPSVLEKIEGTVMIKGHVQRPRGFAWKSGMRVSDVFNSILDLKPNPDLKYVLIKREIQPTREVKVLRINLQIALSDENSRDNIKLYPRDEIITFGLAEPRTEYLEELIENLVGQASYNEYPKIATIIGNVRFPDTYPLYEGMTVKGLVESAFDLRPDTDMDYVIIKRRKQNIGKVEVLNVNLRDASASNLQIKPLDEVYILNLNEERSVFMEPIIKALKEQARYGEQEQIVQISGDVRYVGEYPLIEGMRVKDIVAASGGLNQSAYVLQAEITRTEFSDPERIRVKHINVNLSEALNSNLKQNMFLSPKDRVVIKKIPNWQENFLILINGEVKFPGSYTFQRGETLSNLLQRAGGLTAFAHAKAAVFTREELKKEELEKLQQLRKRLNADIAAASLQEDSNINSAQLREAQTLLTELNEAEAIGRLVIDLPTILETPEFHDIVLKNGDELYIPASRQSITVLGEVQFTSSHLFERGLSVSEYIERSGGATQKADEERIYVVKANGSVVLPKSSKWFNQNNSTLEPGDSIVVPLDADRVKPLTVWTQVTQIIYQMGLAAAAIASL